MGFVRQIATTLLAFSFAGVAWADMTETEKSVVSAVGELFAAAKQMDVPNMFASSIAHDRGFYVMDGEVWWTLDDTIANYTAIFAEAGSNSFDFSDERIQMVTDDVAIYTGFGTFATKAPDGTVLMGGDMVGSVVVKRVGDDWKVVHVHQSFPAAE